MRNLVFLLLAFALANCGGEDQFTAKTTRLEQIKIGGDVGKSWQNMKENATEFNENFNDEKQRFVEAREADVAALNGYSIEAKDNTADEAGRFSETVKDQAARSNREVLDNATEFNENFNDEKQRFVEAREADTSALNRYSIEAKDNTADEAGRFSETVKNQAKRSNLEVIDNLKKAENDFNDEKAKLSDRVFGDDGDKHQQLDETDAGHQRRLDALEALTDLHGALISTLQVDIMSLQRQDAVLGDIISTNYQSVVQLIDDLAEASEFADDALYDYIEVVRLDLESADDSLNNKIDNVRSRLTSRITTVKNRINGRITRVKDSLTQADDRLADDIDQLSLELDQAVTDLELADSAIYGRINQVRASLNSRISNVKSQLKDRMDRRDAALSSDIQQAVIALELADQDLSDELTLAVDYLESQDLSINDRITTVKNRLDGKISSLRDANRRQGDRLSRVSTKLRDLRQTVRAQGDVDDTLQSAIDSLSTLVSQNTSDVSGLESRMAAAESSILLLQSNVDEVCSVTMIEQPGRLEQFDLVCPSGSVTWRARD